MNTNIAYFEALILSKKRLISIPILKNPEKDI